jgi:hypothetical protein
MCPLCHYIPLSHYCVCPKLHVYSTVLAINMTVVLRHSGPSAELVNVYMYARVITRLGRSVAFQSITKSYLASKAPVNYEYSSESLFTTALVPSRSLFQLHV